MSKAAQAVARARLLKLHDEAKQLCIDARRTGDWELVEATKRAYMALEPLTRRNERIRIDDS
jgi:hypothetical protein